MPDIDKETHYKAVKDAVFNVLINEVAQQQLERGYAWIYDAIKEGTKEAMENIAREK